MTRAAPLEERSSGGITYMAAETIPARHAFTTRQGGVSGGAYESLNLGENRGDKPENVRDNYRRLGAALGFDARRTVLARQVHGAGVRLVSESDSHELFSPVPYEADGLVTNVPGLALIVFTADCAPVLLCDPIVGVIAAVHCGWRGTAGDILGAAADKMLGLGARRENIRAGVGPSIGRCCFETGPEVPEAMRELLGGGISGLVLPGEKPGKYMTDLRGAIHMRLLQLGLDPGNIAVSDECTMCSRGKYWSHRAAKGGDRGAQAGLIAL